MYVCADVTDPTFGTRCFPEPEFRRNMNTEELGDLGLMGSEEEALVVFILTLTDDHPERVNDPNAPPAMPSPCSETPLPPSP